MKMPLIFVLLLIPFVTAQEVTDLADEELGIEGPSIQVPEIQLGCGIHCDLLDQYTDGTIYPIVQEESKTISVIFNYRNISPEGTEDRLPIENAAILVRVDAESTIVPDYYKIYTDETGKATFNFSDYAEECADYQFIFCHSQEECELEECLNLLGFDSRIEVVGPTLGDALLGRGVVEPDEFSQKPFLILPTMSTTSYCPPPSPNFPIPIFCFPLMIIFSMLAGAMFLTGRNPFSMFDFSTPRAPKVYRYTARTKGVSIDTGSVARAVAKIAGAAKQAKAEKQSEESTDQAMKDMGIESKGARTALAGFAAANPTMGRALRRGGRYAKGKESDLEMGPGSFLKDSILEKMPIASTLKSVIESESVGEAFGELGKGLLMSSSLGSILYEIQTSMGDPYLFDKMFGLVASSVAEAVSEYDKKWMKEGAEFSIYLGSKGKKIKGEVVQTLKIRAKLEGEQFVFYTADGKQISRDDLIEAVGNKKFNGFMADVGRENCTDQRFVFKTWSTVGMVELQDQRDAATEQRTELVEAAVDTMEASLEGKEAEFQKFLEKGAKLATGDDKYLFQAAMEEGPGYKQDMYTPEEAKYQLISRAMGGDSELSVLFGATVGDASNVFGAEAFQAVTNVKGADEGIQAIQNRMQNAQAASTNHFITNQLLKSGNTALSDNTEIVYAAGTNEIRNAYAAEAFYAAKQEGLIHQEKDISPMMVAGAGGGPAPGEKTAEGFAMVTPDALAKAQEMGVSPTELKRAEQMYMTKASQSTAVDEINFNRVRFASLASMQAIFGEKVDLSKSNIQIPPPPPDASQRQIQDYTVRMGAAASIYSAIASMGVRVLDARSKEKEGYKVETDITPKKIETFLKENVFSPDSTIQTNPQANMLFFNSARNAMDGDNKNGFTKALNTSAQYNAEKDSVERIGIMQTYMADDAIQKMYDRSQQTYLMKKDPEDLTKFIQDNNLNKNNYVGAALRKYNIAVSEGNPREVKSAYSDLTAAVADYSPDNVVTNYAVEEKRSREALKKGFEKLSDFSSKLVQAQTHPGQKAAAKAVEKIFGAKAKVQPRLMDDYIRTTLKKPGAIHKLGLDPIAEQVSSHEFRTDITTPKYGISGMLYGGTDRRSMDALQRAQMDAAVRAALQFQ